MLVVHYLASFFAVFARRLLLCLGCRPVTREGQSYECVINVERYEDCTDDDHHGIDQAT